MNNIKELVINIYNKPYISWILLAIALFVGFIIRLSDTVNALKILKASIFKPLAKQFKYKILQRIAIKSDAESRVNDVVLDFKKELPKGWVNELHVKFVKEESTEQLIEDNKIVLRVTPLENGDSNFVKILYTYMKNCFFPSSKKVLTEVHFEATILQFCERAINKRSEYRKKFEDEILEPIIDKKDKVPGYLERLNKLDDKGFFTGIFVREIDNIATKARLTSKRKSMGDEYGKVLTHLEEFINKPQGKPRNDYVWKRKGPISSYGIILVAQPEKAEDHYINGYVNRGKEKALDNIDNLYVFGTEKEKDFALRVISAIKHNVPDYKYIETYQLYKDYRGKVGGVGALFSLKSR